MSALEENRLILSPYDEKDHEMEYDVIIWEHPDSKRWQQDLGATRIMQECGLAKSPLEWSELSTGLKTGGVLIIQSNDPESYIDPYEVSDEWVQLLSRQVTNADYLILSNQISTGYVTLAAGRHESRVGIFRKKL